MEEGTKSKRTVYVGNLHEDVDEAFLYDTFSTFGDIIEVVLPPPANANQQFQSSNQGKHRGFAFVTYGASSDAQDAIDNMDLNELKGRVVKVNLAKPMKGLLSAPVQNRAIWESEEWLQEHVKPLAESGGVQGRRSGQDAPDSPENNDDAMEE
ncbi:RNA-binding domain-containing protein [Coprinellus micaceus]|uniref:RNA-binding domain-containing protein n=1 Tax=Coprinellus micaceus TaxID=71717 RepID=A0A4Y7TQX7_COPMI|nr:RNA-binding domain-containing protein [Coprinellus micaceus]